MAALLASCALTFTVLPNSAQRMPLKPMDLTASSADPNGLMLNPDWYGQRSGHGTGGTPDVDASAECNYFRNEGGRFLEAQQCSTQKLDVDERRPFHGPFPDLIAYACQFVADDREELDRFSVHGHVNWQNATYTGLVYFDDFQDPGFSLKHTPGDGDLDFTLTREDHRGYVKATAGLDHVEHDPGIVLEANRFELGTFDTPWWSAFDRRIRDAPHFDDARALLKGVPATAVGLLGIDTKHGAHTELHPLYALFARTGSDGLGEHYVFLARNWGYEGGCSKDEHLLGRDSIVVAVTAPPMATLMNVAVSPKSAATWVSHRPDANGHTITVKFPTNRLRPVVVGEFDLCDRPCDPRRFNFQPAARTDTGSVHARESARSEEASLEPVLTLLDERQRVTFRELVGNSIRGKTPYHIYRAFEAAAGGPARAQAILHRLESKTRAEPVRPRH